MEVASEEAARAATERIEAWLEDTVRRQAPLTFRDLRKGVQALSARYVEKRGQRDAIGEALKGSARRGAFATYYAALHLLTAQMAARGLDERIPSKRLIDLGAGTATVAAGIALEMEHAPKILALDRSRWALGEARQTGRLLGLRVQTQVRDLARGLPAAGPDDLIVAGWFLNELPAPAREAVLGDFQAARGRGAHLLILEPLARAVAPWWDEAVERLALPTSEVRGTPTLPGWIRDMDRAAGLDHSELRARMMTSLH